MTLKTLLRYHIKNVSLFRQVHLHCEIEKIIFDGFSLNFKNL